MTGLETKKTVYSHGLESIYAIQTIDLKSVRKIQSKEIQQKQVTPPPSQIQDSEQLEFDFGDGFRNWCIPYYRKEPIQVLNLPKTIEKLLIENGYSLLQNLNTIDFRDLIKIKGMGQGYIEEIKEALKNYLENYNLEKNYKVDLKSFLKMLIFSEDKKQLALLLQNYNLESIVSLTIGEAIELKKIPTAKKQEIEQQLIQRLSQEDKKALAREEMQTIFNIFIIPWMKTRGGIASKDEIDERLAKVSQQKDLLKNILHFLADHYFDKMDLFNFYLRKIDDTLFAIDNDHYEKYINVLNLSLEYFYHFKVHYELDELINLIHQEFATDWQNYDKNFIKQVLYLSCRFQIIKGLNGKVEISINLLTSI